MVNMSLIAKQLLIVWRRCFDDFKVVMIKANIVLIYANTVHSIFGSPKFSGVSRSFLGAINGDDN